MNANKKRELMLEHNSNPINRETVEDKRYIKINSNNESCIDNINLYILIENLVIKDLKFDGEACAITTSSTSIMIKNLIGKTVAEAKEFIDNFEKMINQQPFDKDILKEAIIYDEIYKQNNRKTCALLPYIGIKKELNGK